MLKKNNSSKKNAPDFSLWRIESMVFPIIVGLIIVLGTIVVIIPKVNEIITTRESIKADTELLEQYRNRIAQLKQVDEEEIPALLRLAKSALPESKPFYEVLSQLQSLSAQTGILLGDYGLTPGSLATPAASEVKQEGEIGIKTTLNISGTYDQINTFMDEMQKTLPLFTVTNIAISDSGKADSEVIGAELNLTIYYKPSQIGNMNPNKLRPLVLIDDKMRQTLQTVAMYSNPTSSNSAVINYGRTDIFNY